MQEDFMDDHKKPTNPFHPLDLTGCYEILDSMSEDELLEFGSNPMIAYRIVNQAFTLRE
jgi:hypothetical protein